MENASSGPVIHRHIGKRFVSYVFKLFQVAQYRANIGVEKNGLRLQSSQGDGLAQIDAGIGGPGILRRHAQKRHFDDAGGVAAHAQLQKQDAAVSMPMQKILIPPGRGVPALILHKSIVTAQVRGLWPAALGAAGNQLRRHTHFRLLRHHPANNGLVIIRLLMAGLTALPEAVVTLGVEQPRLIKTSQLKLMVHIGCQDKIIPAPDQIQQICIGFTGCQIITVIVDVPAPPGPIYLRRGKRIKATGIHIGDAVLLMEVGEIFQKALAAIGQASRGGKAGARADEYGIGALQLILQPLNFL